MTTNVRLIAALAVVATGCAGTPEKTYEGEERPPDEVAIVKETAGVSIREIDGSGVSGYSYAMLPGSHELLLRVRVHTQVPNVNWTIWSYCFVRLEAAAGERYESVVRMHKEIAPGLAEKVTMEIGVVGADGEMTAQAYSCSPKRPAHGD